MQASEVLQSPPTSHRGEDSPGKRGDDPMGVRPCGDTSPAPAGTHLAPGAGPGWLPRLGGLPEREVIGGTLLTQALCRDAQVTCGHGECGIVSDQGQGS